MTGPDVWTWLASCLDCGKPHEFRRADPRDTSQWAMRTWASPVDGHAYRTRDGVDTWRLGRLKAEWEAQQ
jgi:hypothetical protein